MAAQVHNIIIIETGLYKDQFTCKLMHAAIKSCCMSSQFAKNSCFLPNFVIKLTHENINSDRIIPAYPYIEVEKISDLCI